MKLCTGDGEEQADGEEGEGDQQKRIVDAVHKAGKRLQEEAEHKFAEEGTDARVMRESAARAARGEEDEDDASEEGASSLCPVFCGLLLDSRFEDPVLTCLASPL